MPQLPEKLGDVDPNNVISALRDFKYKINEIIDYLGELEGGSK